MLQFNNALGCVGSDHVIGWSVEYMLITKA